MIEEGGKEGKKEREQLRGGDPGSRVEDVPEMVEELGAAEHLVGDGLHTHVSGCQFRDTCFFLTLGLGLGLGLSSAGGPGARHR